MALFNPKFGEMSGSIGGLTFARNRGGSYIRGGTSPIQPNTTAQIAQRNKFMNIAKMWSGVLIQSSREAWVEFARQHTYTNIFGEVKTLSGIAMFVKVNMDRATFNNTAFPLAPITLPPLSYLAPALDTVTIDSINRATNTVTFSMTPVEVPPPDDSNLLIQLAVNIPVGVGYTKNLYTIAGAWDSVDTEPPIVFQLPATYPQMLEGMQLFIKISRFSKSDSVYSLPLETSMIIPA